MARLSGPTRKDWRSPTALNANQVQQVLLNLIINARQAMPNGGRLCITVQTNRDSLMSEISIRDSGTGISPEHLHMIFEPFFSTKTADEQGQGGTGLGLPLCREIIEAHKGRIRVDSAIGRGTTFTLKFPAVAAPAALQTQPATSRGTVAAANVG